MSAQSAINFLRESELIQKAAASQNLVLSGEPAKHTSIQAFDSEAVGTFNVDKNFITGIEKQGFTFAPGTHPGYDKHVYLDGHSNQKGDEIFESDCWVYNRAETNPYFQVYFRLWVLEKHRGVACEPHVQGNYSGGACHQPTIHKLVKFIGEHFPDAHPLIKELATTDACPVISFSSLGLGGIKSVSWLFHEQYGKRETVTELADSPFSPFDPSPNPRSSFGKTNDCLFVLEAEQVTLFKQWVKQLSTFRESLA